MTVRRYTIVAEFDDSIFDETRRALIKMCGQDGREEQIRETLQRDVPNLQIRSVCEVECMDLIL